MVRALLAGMKTQTRRLVEPQPPHDPQHDHTDAVGSLHRWWAGRLTLGKQHEARCRYGQPGDRLLVRESGWERPALSARDLREGADTWPPYEYDVEPVCCWEEGELKRLGWKRRPSIHMPRRASRILLEITGVRVERLQDISEADAAAQPSEHRSHLARVWLCRLLSLLVRSALGIHQRPRVLGRKSMGLGDRVPAGGGLLMTDHPLPFYSDAEVAASTMPGR